MASPLSSALLLLLCFGVCPLFGYDPSPCPFNEKDCKCEYKKTDNPYFPLTFLEADCTSATLPSFTPMTNGSRYEIPVVLVINSDVQKIPERHFAAFKTIDKLELTQTGKSVPVPQKWHPNAFDGVDIKQIVINGLSDLIPAPPSLASLGGKSLESLHITNSAPIQLTKHILKDFPALTAFITSDTYITYIDDLAFAGLEKTITILGLYNATLKEFPTKALSILTNLHYLVLTNNQITKIPNNAFSTLLALGGILLRNNPITSIDPCAFVLSRNVSWVDMWNTSLDSIDLSIFDSLEPLFSRVDLSYNSLLKSVMVSDPSKFPKGARVNLMHSALETIDARLGDLLNQNPNVTIDISYNRQLQCQNLAWMAPHVLCSTTKMQVEGALCADKKNQTLKEYLKSIAPNPCIARKNAAPTIPTIPASPSICTTNSSSAQTKRCVSSIGLMSLILSSAIFVILFRP